MNLRLGGCIHGDDGIRWQALRNVSVGVKAQLLTKPDKIPIVSTPPRNRVCVKNNKRSYHSVIYRVCTRGRANLALDERSLVEV